MLVPQWVIETKRDGGELSTGAIRGFIDGYHRGDIPDYQMAALAMAIYLRGMSFRETADLTQAMMDSGTCLDTSRLGRPVADKHSTGGIGDKISLILAPLAAACGLAVPMISGRGLGITGGTLDKLESIPGYRTDLSEEEFLDVVDTVGCSIIGQTAQLAPADKKLYALRDVTATVPSIPLITASIMCKKLAEGLDALVLDVKVGRGAFMKTRDDARELARNMVRVGEAMGKKVGALLTQMDFPLGHCIGNALEVRESIECLQGKVGGPLWEITLELTAAMLVLGGKAKDTGDARQQVRNALDSGQGLDIFRKMVEAQGGDPRICDDLDRLPHASLLREVRAETDGFVQDVNAEAFGKAVLILGGGRTRADQAIDFTVGVSDLVRVGQEIRKGDLLYTLHVGDPAREAAAQALLADAIHLADHAGVAPALVLESLLP